MGALREPSSAEAAVPSPVLRVEAGEVMRLVIDNPPVNAINAEVRRRLNAALTVAAGDARTLGVVIVAAGRLFSGGGDLRELGRPDPPDAPTMSDLCHRIENFSKPVAVGIHGRAIGGGVLLSLACHSRLGTAEATIALPEVRLGFSPGAGGTQRLPRLVGLEMAFAMTALAKTVDAPTAHRAGFFDVLAEDPTRLIAAATARVRAMATGEISWRATSARTVPRSNEVKPDELADRYRALARAAFPGREAPHEAIDLVLDSLRCGFAEGMQRERAAFKRLSQGPQARALLHLFFAERAIAQDQEWTAFNEASGSGAVRVVAPPRKTGVPLVEVVADPEAAASAVQQIVAQERRARRLPVVVRGESVAHALEAAYQRAAAELEAAGAERHAIAAAAAHVGLPPPFGSETSIEPVPDKAVSTALLRAFVSTAETCVAAGQAARPDDVDVIAVHGCGFPAILGGPLFYARAVGGL